MTTEQLQAWPDAYVAAWRSYDEAAIRALFADGALAAGIGAGGAVGAAECQLLAAPERTAAVAWLKERFG